MRTRGPGLVVCLNIGFNIGKASLLSAGKKFFPINHLEGHVFKSLVYENAKISFQLI